LGLLLLLLLVVPRGGPTGPHWGLPGCPARCASLTDRHDLLLLLLEALLKVLPLPHHLLQLLLPLPPSYAAGQEVQTFLNHHC
jgi:hypothetical protein